MHFFVYGRKFLYFDMNCIEGHSLESSWSVNIGSGYGLMPNMWQATGRIIDSKDLWPHIAGFMQKRRNSSALAMELHLFYIAVKSLI